MARYDPKNTALKDMPADQRREHDMQEAMKAGEVVQMRHPGRGIDYITNTPKEIQAARLRGWEDLESTKKAAKSTKKDAKA